MSRPPPHAGPARGLSLAEAVANGQLSTVRQLIEESACDIDAPGTDGTTPLCAASLWGDDNMVKYLLSRGANVNAVNTGTLWTPLHAAAFQEHGKIVRTLFESGADPLSPDAKGRTPQDFATISEAIWPFFQANGCVRTPKTELVAKGIVRKAEPAAAAVLPQLSPISFGMDAPSGGMSTIASLSRPGSAYVRVSIDPTRPPTAVDRSGRAVGGYAGVSRVCAPAGSISPAASPVGLGDDAARGGHVDPLEYARFAPQAATIGVAGIASSRVTVAGLPREPSLSSMHL